MKEIDLKNIWGSDSQQAKDHFATLTDPEKLAKKQSKNILQRIRRNMLYETIFSTILVLILSYAFYQWDKILFWGWIVLASIALLISIRVYGAVLRELKRVPTQNVRDSLAEYVRLVGRYIRRLTVIVNYITPVGYLAGLALSAMNDINEEPLREILIPIVIGGIFGLPFIFLMIWFFNKKYIKWLYGRHHEALKETLAGLEAK